VNSQQIVSIIVFVIIDLKNSTQFNNANTISASHYVRIQLQAEDLSYYNVGILVWDYKAFDSPTMMARFCGVVLQRLLPFGIIAFHCIPYLQRCGACGHRHCTI